MSLTISEKKGNTVPPLPDGTYPAICYLLADIGVQNLERFGRRVRQVVIGWEVCGETVVVDGEEKPRTFFNTFTASLDSKSKLRTVLKAWRGRDFTIEELKAFDLANILKAPCFITVTSTTKEDGRSYANLAGVAKLTKGFAVPELSLEPVLFDIDTCTTADLQKLPEWIRSKVVESESYVERQPGVKEIGDEDGQLPF